MDEPSDLDRVEANHRAYQQELAQRRKDGLISAADERDLLQRYETGDNKDIDKQRQRKEELIRNEPEERQKLENALKEQVGKGKINTHEMAAQLQGREDWFRRQIGETAFKSFQEARNQPTKDQPQPPQGPKPPVTEREATGTVRPREQQPQSKDPERIREVQAAITSYRAGTGRVGAYQQLKTASTNEQARAAELQQEVIQRRPSEEQQRDQERDRGAAVARYLGSTGRGGADQKPETTSAKEAREAATEITSRDSGGGKSTGRPGGGGGRGR